MEGNLSRMETEKKQTPEEPPRDGFDPVRRKLLAEALIRVPFEGWTRAMMDGAARDAGVAPAACAAAFPGAAGDLLAFWSSEADNAVAAGMRDPTVAALRVRDKVAHAITLRLDALRPHKEAARRAAAALALPALAPLGARLAWKSADVIWRALGDKSTDFNFYTKRGILVGVLTSTMARWFADDDPLEEATQKFLSARIDNVMQFEKLKKRVREAGFDPKKAAGWLGKLRYPEGRETKRAHEESRVDEALEESFPASDPPYWNPGANAPSTALHGPSCVPVALPPCRRDARKAGVLSRSRASRPHPDR